MNQLEINVVESFRRAKNDIIELHNQVNDLSQKQEKLMEILLDTRDKNSALYQRLKELKAGNKVVNKIVRVAVHAKKEFVASKEGKKFHIPACPFAKNIKPKGKVVFKSKTSALNAGYKACNCVKRV